MGGLWGYTGVRPAFGMARRGLERLGDASAPAIVLDGCGFQRAQQLRPGGMPAQAAASGSFSVLGGSTPCLSCDRRIAVVQTGIVENEADLRRELRGHRFGSATDGEALAHLIEHLYRKLGGHPLRSVTLALDRVRGVFALGVAFADYPDLLVAARVHSPLVLGLGEGENFLASDPAALLPYSRRIVPLEDGEVAKVDRKGIQIFDRHYHRKRRRPIDIRKALHGGFPHALLKEIFEQPALLAETVLGRWGGAGPFAPRAMSGVLRKIRRERRKGTLGHDRFGALLREARQVPALAARVLEDDWEVKTCARKFSRGYDFFYVGRGRNMAAASEGARWMRAVAGPAAGRPRGRVWVVLLPRTAGEVLEMRARGGQVIIVSREGNRRLRAVSDHVFEIPACDGLFAPVLAILPLQILAYHVAFRRGRVAV